MITKRPMQRDMFTGNLVKGKPKIGRGNHILLKPLEGEQYAIPGMAHFAGTGPEGKRCSQCLFCRDLPYWGRGRWNDPLLCGKLADAPPTKIEKDVCSKAAELYDGIVQIGGIQFENACRYFVAKE